MTTATHDFLALGLYAAKDEDVLARYLRAIDENDQDAKTKCETEMYYRGMGTRRIATGFQLFEQEQKQLEDLRAAGAAKTQPKTCLIKRAFSNRDEALEYTVRERRYHSPYKCNVCHLWHLTSGRR